MTETVRTIYPIFRYTDVRAAMDFLTKAFDFTVGTVNEGSDGAVAHAELTYGTGMIIVGPRDPGAVRPRPAPKDWAVYVAVDDVDAHHDRAKAAGAEIVRGLTDQPYGSREYDARDGEGNIWSFGTYRP